MFEPSDLPPLPYIYCSSTTMFLAFNKSTEFCMLFKSKQKSNIAVYKQYDKMTL